MKERYRLFSHEDIERSLIASIGMHNKPYIWHARDLRSIGENVFIVLDYTIINQLPIIGSCWIKCKESI